MEWIIDEKIICIFTTWLRKDLRGGVIHENAHKNFIKTKLSLANIKTYLLIQSSQTALHLLPKRKKKETNLQNMYFDGYCISVTIFWRQEKRQAMMKIYRHRFIVINLKDNLLFDNMMIINALLIPSNLLIFLMT